MKSNRESGRSLWVAAMVATALSSGCATFEPKAEVMEWRAVTWRVAADPAAGTFTRRGLASFKDGAVALQLVEGRFIAPDRTAWAVTISYKFEDGSSFTHEGRGQLAQQGGTTVNVGAGTISGGSGRFAGITGKTSALGRNVFETEQYIDYKAEYKLPGK